MFGKSQAKLLLRYYEQTLIKLFDNFIAFSQASMDHIISHNLPQWVCGQISENIFFFWIF